MVVDVVFGIAWMLTGSVAVVEQYRLLHGMLQVIQEVNSVNGFPICNEQTCPTMSAGRYVQYKRGNRRPIWRFGRLIVGSTD